MTTPAPLLTANKCIAGGLGLAPVLLKRAATVELDWDVRQKSRFDCTDSQARHLGVFLPRGTLVRGGDVLVAEDGSMVRVIAAPQPVLRITACAAHGSPFDLTRAAYHLGNRHVPIELKPDHLKIEPDHVLADLLRAMHLTVHAVEEAFEPEGGAYSAGNHVHGHAAGHGHDHGNNHAHQHGDGQAHSHAHAEPDPDPAHDPAVHAATRQHAATPHVHGPGCNHGHAHGEAAGQPAPVTFQPRKPPAS